MATLSRRTWLFGFGSLTLGVLAATRQVSPLTTAAQVLSTPTTLPSSEPVVAPTGNALSIPPLLSPPVGPDGMRTFDLSLQRGQMRFLPDRPVQTFGINGAYLGPTLRASQGDMVNFNISNQLGEPTTLHWHGMLLPAMSDGNPHQEIAAGATWQPMFDVRQQAATLWFHSQLMGRTRAQVTRGLASLFILDDDNPAQAALPHTYGVDDIPLILQDDVLDAIGGGRGGGGAQTLVNGAFAPVLDTAQARLRFRLLNASDQRIYTLGFAGDAPFWQVASDGGLLPAPVRLTRVQFGPARPSRGARTRSWSARARRCRYCCASPTTRTRRCRTCTTATSSSTKTRA
jgi:FtsP/CotA-like multicopper oxidase with cupredoxin domain